MKIEEMTKIYITEEEAKNTIFSENDFINPFRYYAHGYVPEKYIFKKGKSTYAGEEIEDSGELGILHNVRYFKKI